MKSLMFRTKSSMFRMESSIFRMKKSESILLRQFFIKSFDKSKVLTKLMQFD
jgi:hypothetical protein